jgi:serine/threonine protein kinase
MNRRGFAFLREARAAASVRHPNVAWVLHLGRTGQNYFYAMEFVEGETLEHLIKRSGRLELPARSSTAQFFKPGEQLLYGDRITVKIDLRTVRL